MSHKLKQEMTNDNQHIPSGYKSSPLGIIPKDWEVKRLGDFAPLQRGFDLPTDKIIKGDFPVVYSNGILNYHHEYKAKGPGVVTGRSGTIGKVTFVESDYWPHNTSLWVTDFNGNNPKYVFYLYSYMDLSKFASGSGVPTLNRNDVHISKIAVPPIDEQIRIVKVLEFWDTAISKQSALIEKLTQRKRGLMQQLLTGKKRLKGFEGEWKEVRLGDCGNFLSNYILSREQLNEGGGFVQNIHYGDVLIKYTSILDCDKNTLPFVNESAYKDSMTDFVKNGDIVISDTAEDETVGKACEVQNIGNKKILAGLHTMLFRPNEGLFSPFFLGYYINSEVYHSKLIPLIQGIKVCSIGKQAIQNTSIVIPCIDEQNAIASVLVNADKEIEIQKQNLAAMQEQKKGLMQVLLIGKRRMK